MELIKSVSSLVLTKEKNSPYYGLLFIRKRQLKNENILTNTKNNRISCEEHKLNCTKSTNEKFSRLEKTYNQ